MARIEAVTVYRTCGKDFTSVAKASDYIDGCVNTLLQGALLPKGFTVTDCVKITDAVLSVRKSLAPLLIVELSDNDD